MSTTMYYFSGTGNSLKIARDLAAGLDETKLVSLARISAEETTPDTETVGFVFPVYAWGPPAIISRFLDNVTIDSDAYVFAVCTCADKASGTLVKVRNQLRARGIRLSSGFIVTMPTNYIVWNGAPPEDVQQKIFAQTKARIPEICRVITEKKIQEVEMGGLAGRIFRTALLHRVAIRSFAGADKKFTVGAACNGCGICAKVCPVGNIEIVDGRPTWWHHCEQCLACLQWCPQEAIEVGNKTGGRERYHHPEITVQDLM